MGYCPRVLLENILDRLVKIPEAPIYREPLLLSYLSEKRNIYALKIVLNAIREIADASKKGVKKSRAKHGF